MTTTTPQPTRPETTESQRLQEVRFEHSPNFAAILQKLQLSLLVSTYQAGKLLAIGTREGKVTFSFHSFEQVMGVAVKQDQIAVGTRRQIYFLNASHDCAPQIKPPGTYDTCWLSRTSFVTGSIHGHDLAWGREGLWVVNTLFSSLCTLSSQYNFVPRWRPPFISQLIDQDRCHLNGLAMESGVPRYVTVLGETDEPAGWRANKVSGGAILDVATGQTLVRGLCMPHSPRIDQSQLFVLNSGEGQLCRVDRQRGQIEPIAKLPGYCRGLAIHAGYAFIGLSKIRETNVFGGLPIGELKDELRCGVGIVELSTGRTVATLQFHSGVDEIFAVEVIPGALNPQVCGPTLSDDHAEVWVVPGSSRQNELPGIQPLEFPKAPIDNGPVLNAANGPAVNPQLLAQQAMQAHEQGNLQEALRCYRQAMQTPPVSASLLTNLGNLYQDLEDPAAAVSCYLQAVAIDPANAPAQQNLGVIYAAQNQPQRALHHFGLAQQTQPHPINFLLGAQVLPVIYDSVEQVHYWRQRVVDRVHDLAESGVVIDTTDSTIPTSFFLAYQGENDRQVMQDLARIYRGVDCCHPATSQDKRPTGERLRVGFVSAHFCNHTIGRLNLGMIQKLSRKDFEVIVVALRSHNDRFSREFQQAADHYVAVPRRTAAARKAIADLGLDILIFADVGMDTLTQTLCYSRMAPIQAVTWGHPDTTGSPTIDYFISSDLAESKEAAEHYSERLERLPTLGIYYHRPQLSGPDRDKSYFGLDPKRRVYLCPQTLFKFHPGYDNVLRKILESDPEGDLVVIDSRTASWGQSLRDRWQRTFPDAARQVRFIPSQPHEDFLHLLSIADVMLDPFPFCGGNSTYEALAMGTPVVTLPGEFLRGRLSLAMYKRMQMDAPIAKTEDEYVQKALRIAMDPEFAKSVRQEIADASKILFENPYDVTHYGNMLKSWVG